MNKKLLMFGLPLFVIGFVAALITLSFTVNVNTSQSIFLEGDEQSIDCNAGEVCLGEELMLTNDANRGSELQLVVDSNCEDVEVAYVGKLDLSKKNTETWELIGVPTELTYTLVGDNFEYSGVPEGYTLIYYKDAIVGLGGRLENPQPVIEIVSDIGDLPQSDDANLNADYSEAPDNYEHMVGAKIWAVPDNAILEGNVLDWSQWNDFYYETDLIYYFANSHNEITVPSESYLSFYPLIEIAPLAEDNECSFTTSIE